MTARRGFTLVEVMVTIAIIGVLVGLTMPLLSSASGAARAAQCQSNLRQMGFAAQAYSNIEQAYPVALRYEIEDGVVEQHAWDWVTTTEGAVLRPGALWAFMDDPDHVCQCPVFHGNATFSGDPYTGYNYNTTFIGAEGPLVPPGWEYVRRGLPMPQHRRLDTTALFGDGAWTGGANKFMRAPMNTVEGNLNVVYAGAQAFRHQGTTNVAYLDGHVGSVVTPRRGRHATESLLDETMGFPENGFLSEDDSAYDPR